MGKLQNMISNIFKTSNIGTIIFFVLNFMILFCIFGGASGGDPSGIVTLVIVYIISLALSFSSIGQAVLCHLNGARKIVRLDMRERVIPVVEEVYLAAKHKTPELPDRINVRIMYDPNPNAFAIGTNTICVTEGMLDMPDNLMAGIIAHELGHLALQHTVIQILIGGGNLIMTGIMLFLEVLKNIFAISTVAGSYKKRSAGSEVGVFLAAISAGVIYLWTKFCMLILRGSSRANEYAADAYAFEIGYGDDLAEALDRLTMGTPQATLLKMLSSTHPEPGDRIGRLQSMGATYSRY